MYDTFCAEVGNRLGRQGDCDMPQTFCSISGFMAEEMPGCLLVMLFTFHTSRYREIILLGPSTGTRWDWATQHTSQTG
jgi:hypothetical protein